MTVGTVSDIAPAGPIYRDENECPAGLWVRVVPDQTETVHGCFTIPENEFPVEMFMLGDMPGDPRNLGRGAILPFIPGECSYTLGDETCLPTQNIDRLIEDAEPEPMQCETSVTGALGLAPQNSIQALGILGLHSEGRAADLALNPDALMGAFETLGLPDLWCSEALSTTPGTSTGSTQTEAVPRIGSTAYHKYSDNIILTFDTPVTLADDWHENISVYAETRTGSIDLDSLDVGARNLMPDDSTLVWLSLDYEGARQLNDVANITLRINPGTVTYGDNEALGTILLPRVTVVP